MFEPYDSTAPAIIYYNCELTPVKTNFAEPWKGWT